MQEVIAEKWSCLGYILMIALTRSAGGGAKNDFVFGLSNRTDAIAS